MKKLQQIKQHNLLTQARYDMSALEMDIFFLLLSQLDEKERSRKLYRISITELETRAEKEVNVTRLKESTSRLRSREYSIEEEDGSYLQVGLLASARYIAHDRILELELSMRIEQFLFDLKSNFTVYYLENALKLKSKFAKRIYQLLSQFRSTGIYRTTLLKLKEQLGLYVPETGEEKFEQFSTFKKHVMDIAQAELEKTDMKFTYQFIKEGRSFKWVEFYFAPVSIRKEEDEIQPRAEATTPSPELYAAKLLHPEETMQPGKRLLYDRMTEDCQLSPKQISLIFENFSLKEINKTLFDLQIEFKDKAVKNRGFYTAKRFEMDKPGLKLMGGFIV